MLIPLNDFVFKKIFGEKKDRHLLIGLLSAILNEKITNITIMGETLERSMREDKLGKLDVKAELPFGEKLNIEVQLKDEYNMVKRTLFYWSKLYTEDFQVGGKYRDLTKTITINIVNFSFLKEPYYHNVFHLKNDNTNNILTKNMEIHFIEMPKFRGADPDITNPLDRWLLFLDEKTPQKSLKEVTKMDPLIKKAEKKLNILRHDPKAREQYESWAKLLSDHVSALDTAERKGEKRGEKRGEERGIEKGKLEVAASLLKSGMSYEQIAEITGITVEKIKKMVQ
ncbi:PD-(D/E)XK nuclease family transposase [Bacillaceae bacterium Marseille-Q3522]|nr:PD-(D/E)XK nuclease family transposase [Bacillaceae bacterium Marseille-Q3522]